MKQYGISIGTYGPIIEKLKMDKDDNDKNINIEMMTFDEVKKAIINFHNARIEYIENLKEEDVGNKMEIVEIIELYTKYSEFNE